MRIKEERSYLDISRWLKEVGEPISNVALAKHAKEHMAVIPRPGRRPFKGRILDGVIESVEDDLEDGLIRPTLKDAIKAIEVREKIRSRGVEQDLMLRIAITLGGRRERLPDPEVDALEGEFKPLLTSGDDQEPDE